MLERRLLFLVLLRVPLLLVVVSGALGLPGTVHAQSYNIDFGQPEAGPPADYAAAGRAGHWNSIVAEHGSTTWNLMATDGTITDVRVWQFGGTENLWVDDPAMAGDDATVMNDFLVTYTAGLESCLFFRGLQPGSYRILVYARMPARPEVLSYTSCDEEVGFPHYSVGGEWSGKHELLVSYSEHFAEVSGGEGLLRVHSGIVPGADPRLGAALNAIQLEKIETCPADFDGSGGVDFGDLLAVLAAWGSCPGCPEDLDGNGTVEFNDVLVVLGTWGECPE